MTPATPAAPGTAPGGGAQEAATPGRAAHDAWWDALPHRRNHPDYAPYDRESAEDRRAWDAAAEAVAAPLREELAMALKLVAACREIQARHDRYRAALERIAALDVGGNFTAAMWQIARGALEATP